MRIARLRRLEAVQADEIRIGLGLLHLNEGSRFLSPLERVA